MRTVWTAVVDGSEDFVRAWTTNENGDVIRHGFGPTLADAIEDALGHPMQHWHETMGGEPWYGREK